MCIDRVMRAAVVYALLLAWPLTGQDGGSLAPKYAAQVDRRLEVPAVEQAAYGQMLREALEPKNLSDAQYVVLVDRSPFIQAVMLFWMSATREFVFIGASPVSTGKPGTFDHFKTPLGVFEHTIDNLDFRAEGTFNENGIRGYGIQGRRVFDFGWQEGVRGWGKGGVSQMRLQMHATDPDRLESKLGTIQSKGCIRIPATLDVFLDNYGILDGHYERAMAEGRTFWDLSKERTPTPWSGRYLVIVESARKARPGWAVSVKKTPASKPRGVPPAR